MRMFALFLVMLTLLTTSGIIYRSCNFKYYGLTDSKKDFYFADGTKHSRGSVKGVDGEWRDRTRKHRYLMVFDKN